MLGQEIKNNPKLVRKFKKDLEKMVSYGFVIKHPTRGGITYQISKYGKQYVEEYLES